jgi:hypothetical protein
MVIYWLTCGECYSESQIFEWFYRGGLCSGTDERAPLITIRHGMLLYIHRTD